MTITKLNHITIAVSNLPRSIAFYQDLLGAKLNAKWANGAYLALGDIWLCLSVGPVTAQQDYSHIALSCHSEDFASLSQKILSATAQWKANQSLGASLYFLDPDGHQLELHLGDMHSRLAYYRKNPDLGITVYD